ncbi:MAG TPA: type III pantothenate kinase [Candidatus Sulfotelmatobacter sp.]|nr:type III pantothenate kinase [Candidatus Sulfotelmatobacter sp.]
MLLAIDVGNTNTKLAIFDGETLKGAWRAATDTTRTADEYAVWLTTLMELQGLKRDDIGGAIIASVVPETTFNLVTLCRRYFNVQPLVVGDPGVKLGITAKIERPEEVGADRLVDAVAAQARYGGPLLIVDFGTATTFNLIDDAGNYAGGVIAPGINLSLKALYMAAAKLPRVDIRRPQRVLATNTVHAMQSGIFWGYIGLIEGIIGRLRAEAEAELPVIATGGLAPLFAGATNAITTVDADLTLRGLLLIYERNRA